MKFHIELKNGHWIVNDKKLDQLDVNEQDFMNRFFREVKIKDLATEKI